MEPTDYLLITPGTFTTVLGQYPSIVPAKLAALDEARYNSIPQRLKGSERDKPSLSKEEVATLVDWKLSHGKFRPTLRALVQQNSEEDVESTTSDAFASYVASQKKATDAKFALKTLTKLRGIGPATASLLLSVHDPETAPFFSDELYRWVMFEKGTAKGWDRSIKYDVKEYLDLYERVGSLKQRFREDHGTPLAAVEIEKVAYVLGKRSSNSSETSAPEELVVRGKKRKMDRDDDEKATSRSKIQPKHVKPNQRDATTRTESPKLKGTKPALAVDSEPLRSSKPAGTIPPRRSNRNRTPLT